MKSYLFGICIALIVTPSAFAGGFHAQNIGFAAPTIVGTSNVYSPEIGAIVMDQSTSSFYGYNNAGTWILLGGSGGSSATPAGVIQAYAGSSAPTGYLLCDGSSLSTTAYPALFAAIGYTYGGSGGSFNLPNTQGVFLRGDGSQTIGGITYSTTQGTSQNDATAVKGLHDLGHSHTLNGQDEFHPGGPNGFLPWIENAQTDQLSSSATSVATGYANLAGDAETRPANISVKYIIKY